MTDLILDISETPVRLSIENELLVISGDNREKRVPVADIRALIIAHYQVVYTQAVLWKLAESNASVIVCDDKRQPCAMLMPLAANATSAERLQAQAGAEPALKAHIWGQIVSAKIAGQARLLEACRKHDHGLLHMAKRVKPGDPDNLEAMASRKYWHALFGKEFRRDRTGASPNDLLNYAYAVVRSIVSRALCGSGLHPGLGVNHHNKYDPFCLASDLMEPFRPIADDIVVRIWQRDPDNAHVDKETKREVVEFLMASHKAGRRRETLFDLSSRASASLVQAFMNNARALELPRFEYGKESK